MLLRGDIEKSAKSVCAVTAADPGYYVVEGNAAAD
jgi:hypothetical protein